MSGDLVVGAVALVVIFVLEGIFPYFQGRSGRVNHAGVHLSLAAINGMIGFVFGVLVIRLMAWTGEHSFGLLNIFSLGLLPRIMIGFILFDLWMYFWHRINHEVRFLWLFHRTHHTDVQMDTTTALRFHPVEIIFSDILKLGVFAILGLGIQELLIYKMVFLPVILFHHSNINLPETCDRVLRAVIVTPNMHRVHHSWIPKETNSDYASVFSFWDRIFNSFRLKKDPRAITFGLDKYREAQWQKLQGLLLTPFR